MKTPACATVQRTSEKCYRQAQILMDTRRAYTVVGEVVRGGKYTQLPVHLGSANRY